MTIKTGTMLRRLLDRIVPPMPDFYALLIDQCDMVVTGMEAMIEFMQNGSGTSAARINDLEHQGDQLKSRNLDILNRSFSTPIDREDIYRAIIAIDDMLNYAKTTVNEMQILGLPSDEHTMTMANLMNQGAKALQQGFMKLEHQPRSAEIEAAHVRKTERQTEKVYRKALAELFDARHYLQTLTQHQRNEAQSLGVLLPSLEGEQTDAVATSVAFVVEILKRREVYRHMSNAADRVVYAGEVLHDIVVKAI